MRNFDIFNPVNKIAAHADKLYELANGNDVYPTMVELDPTAICNYSCNFCIDKDYLRGMRNKLVNVMSVELMRDLVDQLDRLGTKSILLKGGGEPTLNPKFNQFLSYINGKKMKVAVISNGTTIKKWCDELINYADGIRISLNVIDENSHLKTHRPYNKNSSLNEILNNVKHLIEKRNRIVRSNLKIMGNFVVNNKSMIDAGKMVKMARDIGFDSCAVRFVLEEKKHYGTVTDIFTIKNNLKDAKKYENENFKVYVGSTVRSEGFFNGDSLGFEQCEAFKLSAVIASDGIIYPCCQLRGNEKYSFGSIKEGSIKTIWKSKKRKSVINLIQKGRCLERCVCPLPHYNRAIQYFKEKNNHSEFL
jgi:radical SAM protein with 4Fe4S-binding SPASM domain